MVSDAPRGSVPAAAMAKLLELTPRRLQQLVAEGVIPRAQRGRYELIPVVQGYVRYLRSRAIAGDGQGGDPGDRARLVRAKADIAEMEAERMRGNLVPADEADEAWQPIATTIRQRCLATPTRAAPLVAVETNVNICHEIIETFVKDALADIASLKVAPRLDNGAEPNGADRGRATLPR